MGGGGGGVCFFVRNIVLIAKEMRLMDIKLKEKTKSNKKNMHCKVQDVIFYF